MGDMGEFWKDVKQSRQEKRWDNYSKSKVLLQDHEVEYEEKANGHCIIYNGYDNPIYDFWLTTGKFISRETKESGRGIKNLLKIIGK